MVHVFRTFTISLVFLNVCRFRQSYAFGALSPNDPASYSRPELAAIKHIDWKLDVNFDKKILSGSAILNFEAFQNISEVILDVSDIHLESIKSENDETLTYKVDEHIPNFGSKLTIALPKSVAAGEKFKIKIQYSTSPTASALQWLEPHQTKGKEYPYLFSQCSPTHARSILPCQDSPAVKFTYAAEVSAPEPFTILMSALTEKRESNKTIFRQPVPLPTNLLAIAVAVLEERNIGPRSKVWSEKEMIEKSAWEFAETEHYLSAAERLCGAYDWTRYDLLVLPPSFPYGAMENPCLTFVTPTLLAGDRSQANVIVHEIAHSWTGNLVSIKNFEHFWLKEGWTVFLERKIRASLIEDPLEAKRERDFHSLLGLQELYSDIMVDPKSPLTKLVMNITGVHPEDTYSNVPYEKGSLFLRYLEDLIGIEPFEEFLRSYIKHFAGKSLDTDAFQTYFLRYFEKTHAEKLKQIDWDTWLYGPGMPPVIPHYDTSRTDAVSKLVLKIVKPNSNFTFEDVKHFTTHQMIYLLQLLLDGYSLTIEDLNKMGAAYKISNCQNSDIKCKWLRLYLKSGDRSKLAEVFDFVNSIGRVKYVRPIYRDLYAWEEIRPQAIENFLKNERDMMHVTAHTLRKELHLSK